MSWEERQESRLEHITRDGWAPGPWTDEPDRIEWRHNGTPCLIVRAESTGALCGYAAVALGHPMHGADEDNVDIRVHGGLTYGNTCAGSVCHVAKPGEADEVWWLGFDCSHCFDVMPQRSAWRAEMGMGPYHGIGATYRDVDYVRREAESLAEQLATMTVKP